MNEDIKAFIDFMLTAIGFVFIIAGVCLMTYGVMVMHLLPMAIGLAVLAGAVGMFFAASKIKL